MGLCGRRSFGHAQLLDDVLDHWDAGTHVAERKAFIKRLQHLARARRLRISFISGDVHAASVGRLYSRPKARRRLQRPARCALVRCCKGPDLRTVLRAVAILHTVRRLCRPASAGHTLQRRGVC